MGRQHVTELATSVGGGEAAALRDDPNGRGRQDGYMHVDAALDGVKRDRIAQFVTNHSRGKRVYRGLVELDGETGVVRQTGDD